VNALDGFFESAVRSGTPLAFAALGELIAQRSGVINLGIEGSIIVGAFAAFVAGAAFGPFAGIVAGGIAGALLAAVFALFVLRLRAQQIIAGTAVTMLGLGLSATLHRLSADPAVAAAPVETLRVISVPGFSAVPVIGPAFFEQSAATYALYLLAPAAAFMLFRTHAGLALRAVGEMPAAARAGGYRPAAIQFAAVATGGMLAGIGGATLVVVQTGTFSDAMSAGRGFIAIAIVALGRWGPGGVMAGALVFGAASALQFLAQAMGWQVPYNLVLASPYILTLVALAFLRGARTAPAALGQPLRDSG
jgi:simple sugar transport system permease protein